MIVYLVTNTINGKRYIGQTTTSLDRRWWFHQRHSNCTALHGAIKKYGAENFIIEPICEPPTIELMNEIETEYIQRYCTMVPNGYNLTEGGRVPRHSAETRAKMSRSHTGRKQSPESIRKTADALRGRKFSPEHLANLSKAHKGHVWTPEARARLGESMKKLRAERFWSSGRKKPS